MAEKKEETEKVRQEEIIHVLESERGMEGWNCLSMAESYRIFLDLSGSLRFLRRCKIRGGGVKV